MKEQFASYDVSLKLKDLGFKGKCIGYYTTKGKGVQYPRLCRNYSGEKKIFLCAAPLWQQAFAYVIFGLKRYVGKNNYS